MTLAYFALVKAFIMHVARYAIEQISKISLGRSNEADSFVSFRFGLCAVDAGCYKITASY